MAVAGLPGLAILARSFQGSMPESLGRSWPLCPAVRFYVRFAKGCRPRRRPDVFPSVFSPANGYPDLNLRADLSIHRPTKRESICPSPICPARIRPLSISDSLGLFGIAPAKALISRAGSFSRPKFCLCRDPIKYFGCRRPEPGSWIKPDWPRPDPVARQGAPISPGRPFSAAGPRSPGATVGGQVRASAGGPFLDISGSNFSQGSNPARAKSLQIIPARSDASPVRRGRGFSWAWKPRPDMARPRA
jgi:hypothetical protein